MAKQGATETGNVARAQADTSGKTTIEVTGAKEALSVGKRDVLVMTFPAAYAEDPSIVEELRQTMLRVMGPDRFMLVFVDGVTMAKVDAPATAGQGTPAP